MEDDKRKEQVAENDPGVIIEASTSSSPNFPQECRSDKRTVKQILDDVLSNTIIEVPSQEHNQNEENQRITKLVTVKDILGDILEYNVCNKARSQHSSVNVEQHANEPSTSNAIPPLVLSISELDVSKTIQLYRTYEPMICACNVLDDDNILRRSNSVVPSTRILPSYSSVMRQGPQSGMLSSESFVQRIPPPSYAQVKGIEDDTTVSVDSIAFGPDPLYLICPVCRIIVMTDIERERANITHWIALILCLCLCWPCCLLPYYMKSCSYTYHSCPTCGHYFGMFNPFE